MSFIPSFGKYDDTSTTGGMNRFSQVVKCGTIPVCSHDDPFFVLLVMTLVCLFTPRHQEQTMDAPKDLSAAEPDSIYQMIGQTTVRNQVITAVDACQQDDRLFESPTLMVGPGGCRCGSPPGW
jgi:hypothetical protein